MTKAYSYTHNRRLYGVWKNMRERCRSPHHKSYKDYGGRGIKVCEEWNNSFLAFASWAYANGYRDDAEFMECTIDRIDGDGDYEPNNCRWVSMKIQCNNRKNNRIYELNGRKQTLAEWSEESRIAHDTIQRRMKLGWTFEQAISTPVRKQKNNRIICVGGER